MVHVRRVLILPKQIALIKQNFHTNKNLVDLVFINYKIFFKLKLKFKFLQY